jgi:spore cortex protein
MKKWLLSVSAAMMLVAGLTGCGGNMDEGDGDQEGFFTNQSRKYNNYGREDAGFLNRHPGEGATGSYYGQGYGKNRGRETESYGARGSNYGNPMTGYQTRARGAHKGSEFRRQTTGFGDRARMFEPNAQRRNRAMGTNGYGLGRGITGDDRPGMVDGNGILNRFDPRGSRPAGYDNQQRYNMRAKSGRMTGHNYSGYYNGEDGHRARRLANRIERMDNVENCRVIMNGNDVMVGLEASGDSKRTEHNVRKMIGQMNGDYDVYVTTDREHLNTMRAMDDRLRAGEPFEEIGATFTDMANDLGRAVQRPFTRSR